MFVAASLLSIVMGVLMVPMWNTATRWGKSAFFAIKPDGDIQVIWRTPNKQGFVELGGDRERVDVPAKAEFKHTYNNRLAYLVNRATGSPVRLRGDEGTFAGLDPRSLYMLHHDAREDKVRQAGTDLAALMKYALIALVIIGLMVLAVLGILASNMGGGGGGEAAAAAIVGLGL